ncbi:ABC transporter ATP-binding protein [Nitrosovibrio tenuis]|uniref:Phospholipid/cholesterol/gamma-HCH transport system ATP-binding protein n=1 Tax=Nitrosovibrio tenuis TaxID=1233 RepID=A0A1H7Q221_9PROT|nr:ATP-binding cassette domain-containing protein [Nitrosovibrio tenuis]SEL41377.1 phospholipid/cholesterol/gamma-HCH transport system ATP-binding protein [Nitrosovibrio tenuis]
MITERCVIEIDGLYTRFGSHVVHEDINLCVRHGEVLALVGGSGSGKTALMREMLGLDMPAQGTVRVFGEPLHGHDRRMLQYLRNRCGVLFQNGALFSALSVYDNIALPMRELRTLDEGMIRDLVMLKLKMVDIAPMHATKMPAELSGGMVKRIALARAMALDPELLFLDEPTAGLDPVLSDGFVKLIQTMRRELTLTIVMATHDLDTLVALSDRIAVLAEQRVVALGSLKEVIKTDHPFIRNYFFGERGKRTLGNIGNSYGG